jgi:hypothetical protein
MKQICFLALLTIVTSVASSQKSWRLNGYASYVFDDGFSTYYSTYDYYEGKIKGSAQYGVGIELVMGERAGIELMYLHQGTTATADYLLGINEPVKFAEFDLNIDYILLAGQSFFANPSGKVEGYGGLMGGLALINLKEPTSGREASNERFAWGARIGANIWASEKIGIKLQAQLLSVTQGSGGGLYFGTGGAGVAVSSYSTIYQVGLGGGLAFKFGQQKPAEPKPTF